MITLLTDFGVEDEYVGVCKGVILGINPDALIVDLSHGIPPQNVLAAAYTLKHAYTYFPKGSIHVAVVDPGVGSARRLLALRKEGHLFLAPDNGLLVPIIGPGQNSDIRSIENEALFLKTTSATFHGRDIFAPVAAHMSRGYPFSKLGPALHANALTPLHHRESKITLDGGVEGTIVSVDRFGKFDHQYRSRAYFGVGHSQRANNCLCRSGGWRNRKDIPPLCRRPAGASHGPYRQSQLPGNRGQ